MQDNRTGDDIFDNRHEYAFPLLAGDVQVSLQLHRNRLEHYRLFCYTRAGNGQGIPVNINLGGVYKPAPRPKIAAPVANNGWGAAASAPAKWAQGGLLPRSVIATGALHSETNQHAGHATAGKRGIPVLDAAGNKLAEVERDEWTLSDNATKTLHSLRRGGSLLALGQHVRQELLTNTTPSPRYAKRLS